MKRLSLLVTAIVGLIVLLASVPVGAGKPGPPVAPDPAIAFVAMHSSGSTQKLMVMNADGSNLTEILSSTIEQYYHPAWSPTGGRLLFQVFDTTTGQDSIWVIDIVVSGGTVQGQNRQLLIENGSRPAWAPVNDHLIAYVAQAGIKVLDIVTGVTTLVVADPIPANSWANASWPAWNPSGTHLAYFYEDESYVRTLRVRQVVDAGGNPIENGFDELVVPASGSGLDWSREGRFLAYNRAYVSSGGLRSDWGPISILDLSTVTVTTLPATDWATMPTWPPTTTGELVFVNRRGDAGSAKRRIVKRDLSTQDEVVLAEIKGYHCWEPDWRRD